MMMQGALLTVYIITDRYEFAKWHSLNNTVNVQCWFVVQCTLYSTWTEIRMLLNFFVIF
jgi:hypothetical protein